MSWTRRSVLVGGAALSTPSWGRSVSRPTPGIMTGDVDSRGAILWARNAGGRLRVRWEASDGSTGLATGPRATPATDYAAQVALDGLPPDVTVTCSARFGDGDPLTSSFRTAPQSMRDVRFHWGGDLAGQGWGIDPNRGGYAIFDAMARRDPDFLVLCGDRIYADGPIPETLDLPDGGTWNNLVTEATSRVAETLDDFHGRYRYHLLDEAYRRFHERVPILCTWDDHEVVDNWAHGGWVSDDRYVQHAMSTLARRARIAMRDHTPMRRQGLDWARMYRSISYGPLLDVFVLDGRSYRSPNGSNLEEFRRPTAQLLGPAQIGWLKRSLARSEARWKVIVTGQPIAVRVWDDWKHRRGHDGFANADGEPRGREHEIEDILTFIARKDVSNVVWLSADVHYAAAHHFDPTRAASLRFKPFWEFVAGPFHAGTFGPGEIDTTFGAEVRFAKGAPAGQMGAGPAANHQFFGEVQVSGHTGVLTVRLFDRQGVLLHTEALVGE